MTRRGLVVRLDSLGDVLVCGPAVRAMANTVDELTVLAGPRGADAARLLPGVDGVLEWACPWIAAAPAPAVDPAGIDDVVERVRAAQIDEALILTSFHQSALPTALVLRLAGVARIAAISDDYPGALLDVRVPSPPDAPEPQRMLAVAEAAGYRLPAGDEGRLAVRATVTDLAPPNPYVAVHPGADAPARSWPAALWQQLVARLTAGGRTVVVTGTPAERALTAGVAAAASGPGRAIDLGGRTDPAALAAVLRGADAVVVANTGPAHLAAAAGTPVVSLFAPVVPAARWAPYGVPSIVLGDQHAACRGTRARECPVPGHPCLAGVAADDVLVALDQLTRTAAGSTRTEVFA
jgi:ADP-heptose:LPS heptosyltransferase